MPAPSDVNIEQLLGRYVIQFSSLELMMTLIAAKLIAEKKWDTLLFATKRMGAEGKRELLVRAVREKLPDQTAKEWAPLLKEIQRAIERRNDLMHGTFFATGGDAAAFRAGRIASLDEVAALPTITQETMSLYLAELTDAYTSLLKAFSQIND